VIGHEPGDPKWIVVPVELDEPRREPEQQALVADDDVAAMRRDHDLLHRAVTDVKADGDRDRDQRELALVHRCAGCAMVRPY
jgi:hypothetical protein